MKLTRPILASMCAVAAACTGSAPACTSPAPAPDAEQTQRPVQEMSPPPEATPEEEPAEQRSSITYHSKDGTTRAYLPPGSPICQEDQSAQPLYEIIALWRFDANAEAWSSIDVAPDVPYRISCNAVLDLNNVLGFDLEAGTYAIAAKVNGKLERDVFLLGDVHCNDVFVGTEPPEGQVALCIVSESSAEVRMVPNPSELEF